MMYIKYLILSIIITYNILFLYLSKNQIYATDNNLQYKKYLLIKKKLKNKNYQDAIKELETLNKKYPFNTYSNQIYFDLIYAYYKSMNFLLTHITIDNFLKLNPHHPNLDYILYIKGLSNMEFDNNNLSIKKIIKLDHSKNNSIYAKAAFHDFSTLISKYPNSQYVADAQKRLIYLKNRIAEHELSIIKFYNKKEAYIAVIHRTEDMLRYFSDTQATYKALLYMHIAYKKLYLTEEANKIMKIINYNKH